jgi:hypothetical protein
MKYSKGVMWLDDCRIPFVDETEKEGVCKSDKEITKDNDLFKGRYEYKRTGGDTKGRFTPNLLVCDDMLNDGVISKSTIFDGKLPNIKGGRFGAIDIELTDKRAFGGFNDSGSSSRYYDLDKWFDKVIDEIQ